MAANLGKTRVYHAQGGPVLLPAVRPSDRALLRSQAGPHAGAWLAAIPADPATALAPDLMHLALRRRMRLPLPITRARCGGDGTPGCRALAHNLGDHAMACPRTGLLARRGFVLERAWIQVVREAIGPEGRVVPQQWLANTTAPGVAADDRRQLDFVIYGAAARCRTRRGPMLRRDPRVPRPTRWQPHCRSARAGWGRTVVGTAPQARPLPRACSRGSASPVRSGRRDRGRWNDDSQHFVQRLVALRARRAPATLRGAASQGWARRWWGVLAVAAQRAACSAVLGIWTMPPLPNADSELPLAEVLHLAGDSAPSRLPLR